MFEEVINKSLAFIGGKFSDLKESLTSTFQSGFSDLSQKMSGIETKLGEKSAEEKIDLAPVVGLLAQVRDAVKANKIEIPKPEPVKIDLRSIGDLSKKIDEFNKKDSSKDIKELKQGFEGKMDTLITLFKEKEFKVPETFKLDDMQFRTLRQSGGSSGGSARMNATRVAVTNVSMTSANTQYSHTFSGNTVNFVIKLRSQGVALLYAWADGKLPTSGDGLAYMTAPAGFIRGQNDVEISGKTIYLQAATASQICEIEEYRM